MLRWVLPGAAPCRWAERDRTGQLVALLQWEPAPAASGGLRLAQALVRAPGLRWVLLQTGCGDSPLWGTSDGIAFLPAVSAGSVALLPCQNYARLESIPPLDRPAALPPGAGTALLNLFAQLMADQGLSSTRYVGPYPTPALFRSLCASFVPAGDAPDALIRFTADAERLAFAGRMAENPVTWLPRPYAALLDEDNTIYMQFRDRIEAAWLDDVPFRRCDPSAPLPAGCRLWAEQTPAGMRDVAGLAALGRELRRYAVIDPAAMNVVRDRDWEPAAPGPAPAGDALPLARELADAALDWAVLRATPALAGAVDALRRQVPMRWCELPRTLTRIEPTGIAVHAGLGRHFRALCALPAQAGTPAVTLALLLLSDLCGTLAQDLARIAQQRLAGQGPQHPAALQARGRACHAAAQRRLANDLPRLAQALAQGRHLPP